jgi:hypothetical protein
MSLHRSPTDTINEKLICFRICILRSPSMSELPSIRPARFRQNAVLGISLLLYCALLAIAIPHHEPWADEAQAWQIARSNSLLSLFSTAIHYEVSSGLWHALLWLLVRLHLPYAGLSWISASLAVCGVCLLLFRSPFPLVLRALLPFTYFFAFQYSVVARSYVLFAPILFVLASFWPQRNQRPVLISVLLGLLANVSAHGFVTALGLVLVLVVERWQRLREKDPAANPEPGSSVRSRILAFALVTVVLLFALWCIVPPRNANWAYGAAIALHRPAQAASTWLSTARHPLQWAPMAVRILVQLLLQFARVLTYGVSPFKMAGCIAWALLFWRWWRERTLQYVAPVLLLAAFCIFSRFETYHAGLIWVLFLFLWWVTWSENYLDPRQIVLVILVSLFIGSQLVWTVRVVRFDMTQAYSPDRAAAPILRRYLTEGCQIDIAVLPQVHRGSEGYFAVGLEPYFASEPFHNAPARYWIWKAEPGMYDQYLADTQSRSVAVLLEAADGKFVDSPGQQRLVALGYRQDASTCGRVVYPIQHTHELCHVFYIPTGMRK